MPRTGERGGPQTRAKIAEVAARLFAERGFDAVPVAEVAREAGVSSVTVFKHFPRKEDLYLDRADDAVQLLRAAVHERAPGTDVLTSLHEVTLGLLRTRHVLAGLDERSVPFFRTVASSPALIARAREITADLQRTLEAELDRDETFTANATLFAALVVAGYSTVLVDNARRRLAGESVDAVREDHRARLDEVFATLRTGLTGDGGHQGIG